MGKAMGKLKWAGDRYGALQNFIAVGDWATYYAANTEFSAAEWLHKNGYLEKREVTQGKRKVHEYRPLTSNAKVRGPEADLSPEAPSRLSGCAAGNHEERE